MTGLRSHIDRFARPPRVPRVPFSVADAAVGSVPEAARARLIDAGLARRGRGLDCPDPARLPVLARDLAASGQFDWRDEAFDVHADPDGPPLTTIDRGALPFFGLRADGVHVNGLVRRPDGWHLWVGRRAGGKRLDPGKLDHIVAGGIPAGLTREATLLKEAAEEASIPPDLAATARLAGVIAYRVERAEGLRRDRLFCYDLELPEDFTPRPNDDEVEGFELWALADVVAAVRDTDAFKFNVNLVLIDLFIRLGAIAGAEAASLRHALAALAALAAAPA